MIVWVKRGTLAQGGPGDDPDWLEKRPSRRFGVRFFEGYMQVLRHDVFVPNSGSCSIRILQARANNHTHTHTHTQHTHARLPLPGPRRSPPVLVQSSTPNTNPHPMFLNATNLKGALLRGTISMLMSVVSSVVPISIHIRNGSSY